MPFTAEQVRALLSVASSEWYGLILFGYQAGLRLSDAAGLTWNNIDLEQRLLTFQLQKTERTRKTMVRRFHPEIQEYLARVASSDRFERSDLSDTLEKDHRVRVWVIQPVREARCQGWHRIASRRREGRPRRAAGPERCVFTHCAIASTRGWRMRMSQSIPERSW